MLINIQLNINFFHLFRLAFWFLWADICCAKSICFLKKCSAMYKWILPAFLAADVFLFLWNLTRIKRYRRMSGTDTFLEVLMFPDCKLYCRPYHFLTSGCRLGTRCKLEHEMNSMVKFLHFLTSANTSVDVCVFNITSFDLADMLVDLRSRNVRIRVVTDAAELTGTQVPKLLRHGIPVRSERNCGNLMHHKFVVVDKEMVATGSFNWTQQAVVGNSENILITNHRNSVDTYKEEFDRLWMKFEPVDCHLKSASSI